MATLTFERFEYKYLLPSPMTGPVRRFIAPYVRPDAHAGGRYTVSNLYLDTPDLEFYQEHARGAADRFKLRLRAYDASGPVFLEVKRKIKNVIVKSRVQIPRDRCRGLLLGGEDLPLEALPAGCLEEFRGRSIHRGVRPVLLIEYDREAYEGVLEDETRITFDRAIRYRPTEEMELAGGGDWIHVDGASDLGGSCSAILVELKFNTTCPAWMVDLVRAFNLERQSFSKYMASMRRHLECSEDDARWDRVSILEANHE
jgi:hypothetical protein